MVMVASFFDSRCIFRLEDCRLQCTDPNKMYAFKRDIILNLERTDSKIVRFAVSDIVMHSASHRVAWSLRRSFCRSVSVSH